MSQQGGRDKAWLHDTLLKEQLQAAMQLSLEEAGGARTEARRGLPIVLEKEVYSDSVCLAVYAKNEEVRAPRVALEPGSRLCSRSRRPTHAIARRPVSTGAPAVGL